MVTSPIALDDVVDQGFKRLLMNKDDDIKVLVAPKAHRAHDEAV